jgi:hypothetical protein
MVEVNLSTTESTVGKDITLIQASCENEDQSACFTPSLNVAVHKGHLTTDRDSRKWLYLQILSGSLQVKSVETARLLMARSDKRCYQKQEVCVCVHTPVFSTTRLNLDISASITHSLLSSFILSQMWCHALNSQNNRREAGSLTVSPGDRPR